MVRKYYPIKEYPVPPYKAPAGYEWHKIEKIVVLQVSRRVYETVFEASWVSGHRATRKRRARRGYYRYVKQRIFTGCYRRGTGHYHIKFWVLVKTGVVPPSEGWVPTGKHLALLEEKIRKQYGKIKITAQHMTDKGFYKMAHVYKDRKHGQYDWIETSTLFNNWEKKLYPEKLYSIAIVYYYIKITGYAGTHIERIKSTYGNFDRPMNVYDLAEYARTTIVQNIKQSLKKSSHLSFVAYGYFGAMTDDEKVQQKYRRKEREKRIKQYEKESKKRIRLNPKGL